MGRRSVLLVLFIVGVSRGFEEENLDDTKVNKITNILRELESDLQGRLQKETEETELRKVFQEGESISDPAFASSEGNGDVLMHRRGEKIGALHDNKDRVNSKSISAPQLFTGEVTPTSVELLILPPEVIGKVEAPENSSDVYDVVFFKEGCEDYWNWVNVRKLAGNVTSFTLTGFLPWTRYGFSVVLDTGYEIGEPAFISVLTAQEGSPSAPTVTVVDVTASNATLLISASLEQVVPPVNSFIIEVFDFGEPSGYFTVRASGDGPTRFVLDQLDEGASYLVTVKPKSNTTVGSCTSVAFTTTAAPPKVLQKSVKSSSLILSVSPSTDTEGRNIRYRLSYYPVGADEDQAGGFTDVCNGKDSCEYHIDGLLGNQVYVISVAALTGLGFGPETTITVRTPTPTRPGLIKIISPYNGRERTNYNLQWRRPLSGGDTITTYYIEYTQIVRGRNWWTVSYVGKKNVVKVRDGSVTSYRIRNLKPDTFYEVRMSAENQQGRSIVTHKIFKTAS